MPPLPLTHNIQVSYSTYETEASSSEDFDSEDYDFEEVYAGAALENTCNNKCNTDADCQTGGGFLQCTKCGLSGTRYSHRCQEEPMTPSPTPAPAQPLGRGCDGQREPRCRGSGRIAMCW